MSGRPPEQFGAGSARAFPTLGLAGFAGSTSRARIGGYPSVAMLQRSPRRITSAGGVQGAWSAMLRWQTLAFVAALIIANSFQWFKFR